MNANATLIETVDAEDLVAEIVDRVIKELRPMLDHSRPPMAVDAGEMARLAGVSRPTIERLLAAGKIPSFNAGLGDRPLRRFVPEKVLAALAELSE